MLSRLVRHVLGWGSLVVGVAGLFLPVLPGVVLLAIGCALLAPDVPFFRRLLRPLRRKSPGFSRFLKLINPRRRAGPRKSGARTTAGCSSEQTDPAPGSPARRGEPAGSA